MRILSGIRRVGLGFRRRFVTLFFDDGIGESMGGSATLCAMRCLHRSDLLFELLFIFIEIGHVPNFGVHLGQDRRGQVVVGGFFQQRQRRQGHLRPIVLAASARTEAVIFPVHVTAFTFVLGVRPRFVVEMAVLRWRGKGLVCIQIHIRGLLRFHRRSHRVVHHRGIAVVAKVARFGERMD